MSELDRATETLLQDGLTLQRAGKLAQAEAIYLRLIRLAPRNADALNLLGLTRFQAGQPEAALGCIEKALALRPDVAQFHANRGHALKAAGRLADAVASFRRAVEFEPDAAWAHYNLGNALRAEGGDLKAAAEAYRAAIERAPNLLEAHNNLGITLRQLQLPAEAAASFLNAVALAPRDFAIRCNLAMALEEAQRLPDAAESYRVAVRLAPAHAPAHEGLGRTLAALGAFDEAIEAMRRAVALVPDDPRLLNNLSVLLRTAGRFDEAFTQARLAAERWPERAQLHNTLGNVLRDLGRLEESAHCFESALKLQPDYADARYGLAITCLMAGRLSEGWEHFESRWPALFGAPRFAAPPWTGARLGQGSTLLLHAEQGFGDTVQFVRYVPLAAARARVVLAVQQPLLRLLSGRGVPCIADDGLELAQFEEHCPLMTLPRIFGTTLATIPSRIPYLHADPEAVAGWRRRLAALPGLAVGIAWSGNPRYAHDRLRSIQPQRLAPLAEIRGVRLVSLQVGGLRAKFDLEDWTAELTDFADTAALIAALDLVISVDTAVVHLAGALGKPVWLLNRFDSDWRWLRDRDDSPWYPTLRQFRQKRPLDWDGVIAAVRDALIYAAARR